MGKWAIGQDNEGIQEYTQEELDQFELDRQKSEENYFADLRESLLDEIRATKKSFETIDYVDDSGFHHYDKYDVQTAKYLKEVAEKLEDVPFYLLVDGEYQELVLSEHPEMWMNPNHDKSNLPWYFEKTGTTIMVDNPKLLRSLEGAGFMKVQKLFYGTPKIWNEVVNLPDEELETYDVKARFEVLLGE